MIGQTIGPYRILTKLGEGGMGTVWKAQHIELPDRLVALKLLAEHLWSSEEARQRFRREAMAVSRLDHPGIATLYHAEQADGRFFLAFKFIDGETVARRTEGGPLALAEAVAVAVDAAEALAHAHAHGVLHRDVTAGNIMIDRQGRGVLVDFGLARSATDTTMTRTGTTQGTLPYLPPEVVKGEAADARSDLYGLGAVLYRMLTGHLPFETGPAEAVLYHILHQRPVAPSALRAEIPPELDDLVLRLLEKSAGDRPASAEELGEALRRLQSHPALQANVTTGTPTTGGTLRRRLYALRRALRSRAGRRALIAIAVTAVLVVAGAIAWQRGWRPGAAPSIPRVAILPARNLSTDTEETAYLAEGLGEEIASRLGELSGLHLIPWMTTQRFTDASQPLSKVAEELHADALVVGSFTSDGERIRVTVTVVDGRKAVQRWSQSYEESVENLFALQKDVALGLALQIKSSLSGEEREKLAVAPSNSPEAYDHFIRGASYLHADDPESRDLAEPFFAKAVELDSTLAEAYVGLGALRNMMYFRGAGGARDLALAERYFRRALRLNPRLDVAERGLMRVYGEQGQREARLMIGRQAVLRGPDDVGALLTRGWAYFGMAPEKAVPLFDRVLELDPANADAAWRRVISLCWARRHEECIEAGKEYVRKFGEDAEVYTWMGVAAHVTGRMDEALLFYHRALELMGGDVTYTALFLGCLYLQQGREDSMHVICSRAAASLRQRLERFPDNLSLRCQLAAYLALLRDRVGLAEQLARITAALKEPGAASGGELPDIPLCMAQAGDLEGALTAFRAFRDTDPGTWGVCLAYEGVFAGGAQKEFQAHPEVQAFLKEVARWRADLAARY